MKHAVYRAFDAEGCLLYIGCSLNPFRRFDDHRNTAVWAERVAYIDLEWHETREDALRAEASSIASERPEFNVGHNRGKVIKADNDNNEKSREMARLRQRRKRARDAGKQYDESTTKEPLRARESSDAIVEMARREGVHTRTIRRWIAAGKIPDPTEGKRSTG